MTPLLQIRDLVVRRGATPVAGPLSLEVATGEVVALVGRNGSGKSSLFAGLAGLLPCAGSILLRGQEVGRRAARDRLVAGLALCPSGRHLFPDLSVQDNVLLGGYTAGRRESRRRLSALEEIGSFRLLRERPKQRAGTLSGGQQQLVALARSLMSNPSLLLLDEPTAGLAPEAREHVADVVRDFARGEGRSVLIAEENLDFACSIGTRVAALLGGRLLFDETSERLTPVVVLQKLLQGETQSADQAGG
jgi:branched-chain amino acid transport system ATP-binding protein